MEIVTVSRNKRTGDRSYTDAIWQVLGRNETHISLWNLSGRNVEEIFGREKKPVVLSLDEHVFSSAYPLLTDELLATYLRSAKLGLPATGSHPAEVIVLTINQ